MKTKKSHLFPLLRSRTLIIFSITCLMLSNTSSGQTEVAAYFHSQYFKTYRYKDPVTGYASNGTRFMDINNSEIIVGYFSNESGGTTALVQLPNGRTFTYQHGSYIYTRFTGINDEGQIVGIASNSGADIPEDALPLIGTIEDGGTNGWSLGAFYASAYGTASTTHRDQRKINDNHYSAGSINSTGSYRKLYIELQEDPWGGYSQIYQAGPVNSPTFYHTYGLGVNNSNWVSGYFLDGAEKPFICKNATTSGLQDFDLFLPYNPGGIGAPGTKITDLSDPDANGKCAITAEYKGPGGVRKGAIGIYTESSQSIQYDTIPLATGQQSIAMDVNNNKDYVGYYEKDGVVYAYVVYANRRVIPGYDIAANYYPENFNNSAANFKYEGPGTPGNDYYYKFDYVNTDPITGDDYDFLSRLTSITTPDPEFIAMFENGQRYPSWYAYGLAKNGGDLSVGYTHTYSGGNYEPKDDQIMKWLGYSSGAISGYCWGMNAMALYAFDKGYLPATLQADDLPGEMNNSTMTYLARKKAIEAMGAAHLYQHKQSNPGNFSDKAYFLDIVWGNAMTYQKRLIMDSLYKRCIDMADSFYSDNSVTAEGPNYSLFYFLHKDANAPAVQMPWGHNLIPYATEKVVSLSDSLQTIYCSDPNFPRDSVKVVIDYNGITTEVYKKSTVAPFNWEPIPMYSGKNILYPGINSFKWHNIGSAAQFRPAAPEGTARKTAHPGFEVLTWGICDYKITNLNDPGQYIEKTTGSSMTFAFPGLLPDYHDSDTSNTSPFLFRSLAMHPLLTRLSGCDQVVNWHYSHPDGEMLMSRGEVTAAQIDKIYNDGNVMKVENPDTDDKFYKLATIANFSDDEVVTVCVDSFMLQSGDTVRFEAVDANHFHLSNGLDHDNTYDLYVRYLSEDNHFIRKLSDIQIDDNTDHIIVIQPEVTGNEVIILVDNGQDGTINDTMTFEPTTIDPPIVANTNIQVYPVPVKDVLNITLSGGEPKSCVAGIFNMDGRLIRRISLASNTNTTQIPLAGMSAGVYILKITGDGKLLYKNKFVKE